MSLFIGVGEEASCFIGVETVVEANSRSGEEAEGICKGRDSDGANVDSVYEGNGASVSRVSAIEASGSISFEFERRSRVGDFVVRSGVVGPVLSKVVVVDFGDTPASEVGACIAVGTVTDLSVVAISVSVLFVSSGMCFVDPLTSIGAVVDGTVG